MDTILGQVNRLIRAGSLPQSMLFSGQDGEVLLGQARQAAQQILKTDNLNRQSDFIYTDSSSVTDLRRLLSALSLRAFEKRVVVLNTAEGLSHQSVNSLLNRLEEPDEQTYFIVITTHESKLLPTLRSRLTIFRENSPFNAGKSALAEAFLQNTNLASRVGAMKNIDAQRENLTDFLNHLYQNQTNNLNGDAVRRLPLILKAFELLEANVQAVRILQWLAVKW